jgi:hypothetical protein
MSKKFHQTVDDRFTTKPTTHLLRNSREASGLMLMFCLQILNSQMLQEIFSLGLP